MKAQMQKWWNGRHAVFRRQCEQSRESSNLFFCTKLSKTLYIKGFFFVLMKKWPVGDSLVTVSYF